MDESGGQARRIRRSPVLPGLGGAEMGSTLQESGDGSGGEGSGDATDPEKAGTTAFWYLVQSALTPARARGANG